MSGIKLVRSIVCGTAVLAVLSVSIAALARPPFVAVLKKVYPKSIFNCRACHEAQPPKLIRYGRFVKTELDKSKTPKVLTESIIRALDKKGIKPNLMKHGTDGP